MTVPGRVRPILRQLWLLASAAACGPARSTPAAAPTAPFDGIVSATGYDGGVPSSSGNSEEIAGGSGQPVPSIGVAQSPAGGLPADADSVSAPPGQGAPAGEGTAADRAAPTGCPTGMIYVDVSFCPRMERQCLDEEYSPQNHFTICHRFATTQRCLVAEEQRRFCIDEYEYPNQKGAHPPWMVSWYDAQATCGSLGKRLCYESEWVSACEGPDKTPFPYGYERDNSKCNIDNTWIQPHLADLYGRDQQVRDKELARLDQSVSSGELSECVSGFGVHDLTGNFDEWVTADRPNDDKSEWAALKGGAWGHVRNACRPTTTSHPPDFTYYFIGFRCCKDLPDGEPYTPKADRRIPVIEPKDRAPIPSPLDPPGPSAIKAARDHFPKPVAGR